MKKVYLLLSAIALFGTAVAQKNVGINTNDPKSTFDVNGNLALREGPSLVLSNGGSSGGVNDNIVLPDITGLTGVKASFYRITGPTAAFSIYGVVPNSGADGQLVTLMNTTTNVMTVKNNASSIAANSIKTLSGTDMVTVAGMSSITLQYNKTDTRWYVTGSENFTVSSTSLPTKDIVPGTGSAITVVNGANQVVGGGNVVVDVQTNSLGQKGIVPGPTGLNGNQAYGTDNAGNPAWGKVQNAQMQNSSVTVNTGTGLSGGGNVALGGTLNLTNTAPDQTVTLTNGAGISATGTYPNFTITNTGDLSTSNEGSLTVGAGTATTSLISSNTTGSTPVTLQAGTNVTLSETGNTITIASSNSGGTVTSIATTAPITGGTITTTGTIGLTQQGDVLAGTGVSVSGGTDKLPGTADVTITNTGVTSAVAGTGISVSGATGAVTITNTGDLSNTNEAQTLAGSGTNDINLTQAGGAGGGTITLQGAGATSINRAGNTFTISSINSGGTVTSVSGTAPISVSNPTTTPVVSMTQAGTGSNGWLSATDFNTFNGKPTGTGTATQVTFWGSSSGLTSDANLYWDNTNKRLGIGTASPADALDVRNALSVNEIKFRNVGGGDDSDPYRLRKVQGSSNVNWLELQLNDDVNEEFRIYGNSCVGYGCAEYSGNLYHYFRADGTAFHSGTMNSAYVNTSDNAVGSGVTGIVVKAGDNNHRTASAAAVLSFLGITAPTGDNLGNHTATTTLNMNGQAITNIADAYTNGWFRNNNVNTGLYNQSTGRHFYSESNNYWTTASANGMIFRNGHQGTIVGYTYWDGTAGSNNYGLLSPSGSWRYRVDNSNTEAYGGFYNYTAYNQFTYDRDNTGYYMDMNNSSYFNVTTGNEVYTNNWFRVNSSGGIYWQAYGGGWNMQDNTWLRTYGNKAILASGGLAGYGNSVFGGTYGTNPRIYANYDNVGAGGIMVSDDGGFFDYNDAYIEYRGSTGLAIRVDNGAGGLVMRMTNTGGGGIADRRIITDNNAWGLVGASGNAFWQFWGYSFNNASTRESKKDITQVSGAVAAKVMEDLDKLHPYLYRYNEETDQIEEGKEAKYRPGLHMGLLVDESPDYIQAQTYDGVDIYAAATLGIAASKVNREDIKEIKTAMGWNGDMVTVQDFGSVNINGEETWVAFDNAFAAKLNGAVPVITLTGNKAAGEMYVTEKTDKGFRIKVAGNTSGLQLDYIAMAKVKSNAAAASDVPAETLSKMYVTPEVKRTAYDINHKPENSMAAIKERAQKEAVEVQKERAAQINSGSAGVPDPTANLFDVKKDAEEKRRKAEEDKKHYVPVPENGPAKNLGVASPAKENSPSER